MPKARRLIVLLLSVCTVAGFASTPAAAAPAQKTGVQAEINQVLASHPGGVQVGANQIAWHSGSVVLTIPSSDAGTRAVTPQASWHGCPSGWYCFYQDANWGGRKLQFSDCPSGGQSQWLTDYGFGNQTTSWVVNRNLNFVNVNDNETGYNLWNEDGNSASSNVGAANNDRADWFICYG